MRHRDHVAASDIALERRVNDLRRSLPNEWCSELELDDEQVRDLCLDPSHCLAVGHAEGFDESIEVLRVLGRNLVCWVMDRQRTADRLEMAGDHERAADARHLAVLGCRCLRLGRISENVAAREYEFGDGFQPEGVDNYDDLCRRYGNVELMDAVRPWVAVPRQRSASMVQRRNQTDASASRGRPRARRHRTRARVASHAPQGDDRPPGDDARVAGSGRLVRDADEWIEVTLVIDGEDILAFLDPATAARILRNRAAAREARRAQLQRIVEHYVKQHPEAKANAVHRAIGGRRAEVLKAVKATRTSA